MHRYNLVGRVNFSNDSTLIYNAFRVAPFYMGDILNSPEPVCRDTHKANRTIKINPFMIIGKINPWTGDS